MGPAVMTGIPMGMGAVLAPVAGSLICLGGGWFSRIGRWGAVIVTSAIMLGGAQAMLAEGTYVHTTVPGTAVSVFCWDWSSLLIAAVALVAACFSFALSEPEPGEDSMVLFQLAMVVGVAIAGNALVLWPLLALSAGAAGIFVIGARDLPPGHALVGGVLCLLSAGIGVCGLAAALGRSQDDPTSILDISLFPQETLASAPVLGLGMLGGMCAIAGAFPLALRHPFEWAALGMRRAAAFIGAGPGFVAMAIWLRVSVHGRESLQAAMGLDSVRNVLYAGVGLGAVFHLARLIWVRKPDQLTSALWGLHWCYGLAALILGNSDGMGLYAFVAWANSTVIAFAGLSLAERAPAWASVPLRVAGWASLLGVPPLAGFWTRYLLLGTVARVHGLWWILCLVPWMLETVAVLLVFRASARGSSEGSRQEDDGAPGKHHRGLTVTGRIAVAAWTTLCLALLLVAGPVGLRVCDSLARQIVTGATGLQLAREVMLW